MSREIKFRIWCHKRDKFIDDEDYMIQMDGSVVEYEEGCYESWIGARSDYRPEMYTGLKDKNGKEIYEGDIVYSDQWKPNHYVVEFCEGCFGFSTPRVEGYVNDCKYLHKMFTVAGNIHENPELLEEKNEATS